MRRRFRTADGFTFVEQPDGTLTDGDLTFDSLEELQADSDVEEFLESDDAQEPG